MKVNATKLKRKIEYQFRDMTKKNFTGKYCVNVFRIFKKFSICRQENNVGN